MRFDKTTLQFIPVMRIVKLKHRCKVEKRDQFMIRFLHSMYHDDFHPFIDVKNGILLVSETRNYNLEVDTPYT